MSSVTKEESWSQYPSCRVPGRHCWRPALEEADLKVSRSSGSSTQKRPHEQRGRGLDSVLAFDNYYTGNLTDSIGPMAYELDMPQFYPGIPDFTVAPNTAIPLTILPNNAANVYFTGPYNGNSPSQTGLLMMYTDGRVMR